MKKTIDRIGLWWYLLSPLQVSALIASALMFIPMTLAVLAWSCA